LNYRYGISLLNKVFARVNNSYRFANTDEVWGRDANNNYARFFSGILLPQKNQTLEIGGEWQLSAQQRVGITVYQLDSENEIRYDVTNFTNINSADIRRVGATLFSLYKMNDRWTVNPRVNLQRARYTAGQFDGKDVGLVPNFLGSIGVAYQPKSNLSYNAFLNYTGTQRYDGDQSNSLNKMPSFTTVDLSANYKYRQWTSSLTVKNLFDRRYANYGGYTNVQINSNTFADSYYYYPADPRGIYISTRYTF
jgi:outer membrane cobalamin receptor